jgi:cell division protein FtsI/penicillin-binding protein 2
MAEGPRRRLQLLSALLIAVAIVIIAQLLHVQIFRHRFYQEWGREMREGFVAAAEPPRGTIRDRNGSLMVGNAVQYSIEAAPAYVEDSEQAAEALAGLLHLPVGHIRGRLDGDSLWVRVAPSVSKEVGEKVMALKLSGITARAVWTREYPEGTLAAHVLGFCNRDGQGFYGVEGFYDQQLRPVVARVEGHVDPAAEQVPWTMLPLIASERGEDLVLTIDRTVQALVEDELARSLTEYQAEAGTIIVMDPRSFEILALASWPTYNPGGYLSLIGESLPPFEDPAVSMQYEPGSVFKVLTVAAALDAGVVMPESTYEDTGRLEVGGREIRNSSRQAYGEQTISDILIKSLNVGAAWLSTEMGADLFYRYVQSFGIGAVTGVDLAGEVEGQVWLPTNYEKWYDANPAVNAFGQGLAVTPLQMIVAVATVANDGTRLRPHVVQRRTAADGTVSYYQLVREEQAISPETARIVTAMLVRAVEEGFPQARVPGYRVAGKTGTAQIPIPGGYDREGTIATFIGYGPVPDPQVIVLVKLDRPRSSPWASQTAALSFQRLASRLFLILGIPPENLAMAEAVQ